MELEKEFKEQKFLLKLLIRKIKRLEKSIKNLEIKNGREIHGRDTVRAEINQ